MSKSTAVSIFAVVVVAVLALSEPRFSPDPDRHMAAVSGSTSSKESCTLYPKPREFKNVPYYTGPLIDAHIHMPASSGIVSSVAKRFGEDLPVWGKTLTPNYLSCLIKSEGITKVFGFYLVPRFAESSSVRAAKKVEKVHKGEIVPFLMPPPMPFLTIGADSVERILKGNPDLFRGYGEIALDRDTSGKIEPDDPELLKMYALAETYNLIVMMHPRRDQNAAVERVISKFPHVRFLLHGLTGGPNDDSWVFGLMAKYENIFYSVDNISSIYGWMQEHRWKKPTKVEWLAYVRDNFDLLVSNAVSEWKPRIERLPGRFVWGTDRWYEWTFDEEVGALMVELNRAFIGQLDPSIQELLAYKNAENLIPK